MKHLKTYKIFESIFNDSQIREYLNDVFLEYLNSFIFSVKI
jgi:hypothetical protein